MPAYIVAKSITDVDWCWLIGWLVLTDADWCWLMLTGCAWCWLMLIGMLIDTDWCWLMLTDADWCWLMLIYAEWCWLILIKMFSKHYGLSLLSIFLINQSKTRVCPLLHLRHKHQIKISTVYCIIKTIRDMVMRCKGKGNICEGSPAPVIFS